MTRASRTPRSVSAPGRTAGTQLNLLVAGKGGARTSDLLADGGFFFFANPAGADDRRAAARSPSWRTFEGYLRTAGPVRAAGPMGGLPPITGITGTLADGVTGGTGCACKPAVHGHLLDQRDAVLMRAAGGFCFWRRSIPAPASPSPSTTASLPTALGRPLRPAATRHEIVRRRGGSRRRAGNAAQGWFRWILRAIGGSALTGPIDVPKGRPDRRGHPGHVCGPPRNNGCCSRWRSGTPRPSTRRILYIGRQCHRLFRVPGLAAPRSWRPSRKLANVATAGGGRGPARPYRVARASAEDDQIARSSRPGVRARRAL